MNGAVPLETLYRGIRFRSRLEARWAIFFDRLEVEWQYEPEGYATRAGNYLPDFYLATFGIHAEIKPTWEAAAAVFEKLGAFRDDVGAILLLVGPPALVTENRSWRGGRRWMNSGTLYCYDATDSSGGPSEWEAFIGADYDHEAILSVLNESEGRTFLRSWQDGDIRRMWSLDQQLPGDAHWRPYPDAVDLARGTRFENGRAGVTPHDDPLLEDVPTEDFIRRAECNLPPDRGTA